MSVKTLFLSPSLFLCALALMDDNEGWNGKLLFSCRDSLRFAFIFNKFVYFYKVLLTI